MLFRSDGHEVFYLAAPDTTVDVASRELAARFFPNVPIRGDLSGRQSFFDSAKAERILGWSHEPEMIPQSQRDLTS